MSREDETGKCVFSAERIAEAVDACCKQDRRLDMYYRFASPNAKRFIELGFYTTHFADQTDPERYARCRDGIAPTLTENDLRYLLRFESDAATKAYLNGLLQQRLSPKTEMPSEPPPQPPSPPQPRKKRKSRSLSRRNKARLRLLARASRESDSFWPKVLALLAVVCVIVTVGAIRSCRDLDRKEGETPRRPQRNEQFREPDEKTVPVQEANRPAAPRISTKQAVPTPVITEPSPAAETVPVEETPVEAVLEPIEETPKNPARRVVLSDGDRIRTLPDGTIEVPRHFSYTGAGLKKPFWIYDRQLEKSGRIEHEARAEKAARDRWKALYDEACRAMKATEKK